MLFSVIAIPRGDCLKFVGAAIHCCRLGSSSLSYLTHFLIIYCLAEIIISAWNLFSIFFTLHQNGKFVPLL